MVGFPSGFMGGNDNEQYRAGRKEGFQVAESYFKKATKDFFRRVKKGMLENYATMTTVSTHTCNCEYCWTNEPKDIKGD